MQINVNTFAWKDTAHKIDSSGETTRLDDVAKRLEPLHRGSLLLRNAGL